MVNQLFVTVDYDVMCRHILHTPCLLKPVLDQLAVTESDKNAALLMIVLVSEQIIIIFIIITK